MDGYDVWTTTDRAKWIVDKLIDLEVLYELEPWGVDFHITVPYEHHALLDYLLERAEKTL